METTLEIRWFVAGTPSVVVQRWFKFECPGELLEDEPDREDLYAEPNLLSDRLKAYLSRTVDPESVNLKLRQGNLELKLRQQELGIYQFGHRLLRRETTEPAVTVGQIDDTAIWSGKIEQWCKYSQQDLQDSNLLTADLVNQTSWLSVHKQREQKIYRNVKIELTDLKVKSDRWWTIAFEMALDSKNQLSQQHSEQHLREVVEQAARSYQGAKLLSGNSYSYSSWQTQFI